MILIEEVLVSRAIIEEAFVCDLNACKGACCVEGDEGAAVTKDEIDIIEHFYDKLKPYLTEEGKTAIDIDGFYYSKEKGRGDFGISVLETGACVFLNYDKKGIAKCGIQAAYEDKAVNWPKPISCHLYPIRIDEYKDFEAINYYEWSICSPACALGKELKVPVYKFLKEPLVRKYGLNFYEQIDAAAAFVNNTEEE